MIKIKLLGFDSMGTRGMATVLDIEGFKIFIDPGVSYAPKRYGLPPHPLEIEAFNYFLEEIHDEAIDAHVFIISHYHRDHYLYREGEKEFYRGKTVFLKDPLNNINYNQKIRAYILLNKINIRDIVEKIEVADNKIFSLERINIRFSKPVPHGPPNSRLGYVIMTLIEYEDYKILHASDVQGPIDHEALNIILSYNPDLLIISGPPTYFEGFKMSSRDILKGLKNLSLIIEKLKPSSTVIVDHHILRDLNYKEHLREIYRKSIENNIKILTAAEYMGLEIRQLEALRKQLWERENQ